MKCLRLGRVRGGGGGAGMKTSRVGVLLRRRLALGLAGGEGVGVKTLRLAGPR